MPNAVPAIIRNLREALALDFNQTSEDEGSANQVAGLDNGQLQQQRLF